MRVYLSCKDWPGGFPEGLVTRTPTPAEVIGMARTFPFNSDTVRHATRLVPCMLYGVPWTKKMRSLDQYTHLRDPYDYYLYCKLMSQTHEPKSKGWLPSVARLLICWMAEELRTTHGIGNGFADHFHFGALGNPEEPPMTEEEPAEETETQTTTEVDLGKLLEYYDEEMREVSHDEQPGGGGGMTVERCVTRAFPLPPNQNAQRARTLGNNENLKEYLRTHASLNNRRVRRGAGVP